MGEEKLKRAFVFSGGVTAGTAGLPVPEAEDFVIAADSGYDLASRCGVTPDLLVGDLDSIRQISAASGIETVRVKAEKDFTDTMMAVDIALSRGFTEITVVGGLGGRVDHSLSNLFLLEYLNSKGIDAVICNGENEIRFLKNGSMSFRCGNYRYFSLVAADPVASGVSVTGGKYPLKDAVIERTWQYAVSNEPAFPGAEISVSVENGSLFVICSSYAGPES
ncbi:MAG: thiamine diphosphokinase [Clostridia bacterium]|nr:thiamine diphosphokinase [Clostridia bacterium]